MSTDVPSSLDLQQLPDDPALLKQIIAEREQAHRAELQQAVESAVAVAVKSAVKAAVEATTAALLKRFYGPKNETFDPRQLLLFGERIDQLPLDETKLTEETGEEVVSRRVQKKHKHGRNPLPDHLPRIEIEHDLSETDKLCPCCGEVRCRIGQEIASNSNTCRRRSRCCDTSGRSTPAARATPRGTAPIFKRSRSPRS